MSNSETSSIVEPIDFFGAGFDMFGVDEPIDDNDEQLMVRIINRG